ncbi:MAG: NAD(P)-binding domain-containing protein [Ardenticatenales bacterium]|nr:NAD(P)-binding domain-containing protein [Ardenticatenales bacterium]
MTKIAVIGAGPSGIVMTKELIEQGFDVTCFEAGDAIGGVFATTYENCQLTSSTLVTRFSDFDDPDSIAPRIWMVDEYLGYLRRYVDHFKLAAYIQFSTRVEQVRSDGTGDGYQVITRASDGQTRTHRFDRVAVCTGTHQEPSRPNFSGAEAFQGRILHSAEYQNPSPFTGRRVLVVGGGESGSDISRAVAEVAAASAISIRGKSGFLVPRYFMGNPADIDTARSHYSFPVWWGRYYHSARFYSIFPLSLGYQFFGSPEKKAEAPLLRTWARLQLRRHPSAFTTFGTKNLGMVEAMTRYGCELKPAIDHLDARGAVFTDGSRFDCDVIICATGFQNHFPFLEEAYGDYMDDLKVSRRLYKHCIHPKIGETMFFCGFARPHFGALPPVSEMQARWFALLTKGDLTLPSIEEMEQAIAADSQATFDRFGATAERITTLISFLDYLDDMARIIGCAPPLAALKKRNPRLWRQIVLGPICTAQYRLRGPGAKPEVATEILMQLPLGRNSTDLYLISLFDKLSKLPGLGHFAPSAAWI